MASSFDSRAAGTPEHVWATSWLASLPALDPPAAGDRLLIVAAHPDDETLGAGGLMAIAARSGVAVTVVIATDGEASHPQSPTHSPAHLASTRRVEVAEAVSRLHPDVDLHFLGLPDSRLAGHGDELGRRIRGLAERASLVVTPWTGDRHPDHAICATAGALAARASGIAHWQFPIWAWHWGTPRSPELSSAPLARLPLDEAARTAKRRALEAHVSQHTALSPALGDEAILSESMLAHFGRPDEVFVVTEAAPAASSRYFDDLYAVRADPWGLAERFYERRKRHLLLASLPRERFRRAFEPGCATGLLTTELARRCDEVVACDGARAAVDQAIARVGGSEGLGAVTVECARIPTDWPSGRFDLIVLSEVGYYCPDQRDLKRRIDDSLAADGVLVACHWRHRADDHPVTAEDVHASVGRSLHRIASHCEDDFLLDVWTRDGISVATAEGIAR